MNLFATWAARCGMMAGLILVGIGARAEETPPRSLSEANKLLNAGTAYIERAAKSQTSADAVADLERALEQFTKAARAAPDFFKPQSLWADTLYQLARLQVEQPARCAELIKSARERFAIAAACPGVIREVFSQWSAVLDFELENLAGTSEQRNAILREQQRVLNEGIRRATYSYERAPMQRALGMCLAQQAKGPGSVESQMELFRQAIAEFAAASKIVSFQTDAGLSGAWGMALVDLGRLSNDHALIEQALEKLQATLALQPDFAPTLYNIACCYAALKKTDEALAYLQRCLDNDPQQVLRRTILTDRDLAALRLDPRFQQMLLPKPVAPSPLTVLRDAQNLQREGEDSSDDADAVRRLENAVDLYRQTLQIQPDMYIALNLWARSLYAMARHTADKHKRTALIQDARERFAIAARCKEVDWQLFYGWAEMLSAETVRTASNPAQRRDAFQEAKRAYDSAMSLATFESDRALVEGDLARCFVYYADACTELTDKRDAYKQALTHFQGAAKSKTIAGTAHSTGMWGLALLQLGRLDHDRVMVRQSIGRLQTAIELDPKDAETRYNIACAYVLMTLYDQALAHLRACFENDPTGLYLNAAKTDPDLKVLEALPKFRELIGNPPAPSGNLFPPPPLSNR